MTRILFVCHGNICRSPMAEFVFGELARRRGLDGLVSAGSAATSTEEIGNPVHPGTLRELRRQGIPAGEHRAVQLVRGDYGRYDYLIGMDHWNLRNMQRILGEDPQGKLFRLLDFTDRPGDIADPWYSGDFETTFTDVREGVEGLLRRLEEEFRTGRR